MPFDTFVLIANTYDELDDALADYEAARHLYLEWGVADTYDAAVITRSDEGKVKIAKHHEEPAVQGGVAGLGVGLAVGALFALFPAIGIGAGLAVGGAGGAALGAFGGHVVAGLSRHDLKELGEHLDAGQSGLLIVAAEDVEARIDAALTRGARVVKKQLRADEKELEALVDAALAEATH
jgi:uncharacterized membrane protein